MVVYQRNHNLVPLWVITKDSLADFHQSDGTQFSKLKYGDSKSIGYFADKLANSIWRTNGEALKLRPESFRIVAPAFRNSPTSAALLCEKVQQALLDDYDVDLKMIRLCRRETNGTDYGKLKDKAAREGYIRNNFYYVGESLEGLTLLFIEDALVSGVHYVETQRALEVDGSADLSKLFCYIIVDVRAETFGEESYAVEDVLNHVWINKDLVDRLVKILQKQDSALTPRLLKMVATTPWIQIQAAFNTLPTSTVLEIQKGMEIEEFSKHKSYEESTRLFREYAWERLRQEREKLHLSSAYLVDESSKERFFNNEEVWHPALGRLVSFNQLLSLLRLGDGHASNFFSRAIAQMICQKIGHEIWRNREEWGVVAVRFGKAPSPATILAKRIAALFGLPLVDVFLKNDESGDYLVFGDRKPRLIVIDDLVVSGRTLDRLVGTLSTLAVEVLPFVAVAVASPTLEIEKRMNEVDQEEVLNDLLAVLADPESVVINKTVRALLSAKLDSLSSTILQLPRFRKDEIGDVIRVWGDQDSSECHESLEALREVLGTSSLEKRTSGRKGRKVSIRPSVLSSRAH